KIKMTESIEVKQEINEEVKTQINEENNQQINDENNQQINEINNQQINEINNQQINEINNQQINEDENKLYEKLESIDSESVISENSKKLKNYRFYILFEVYLNFSNKITKDELIKLFNDFYDAINEIFGRKENYLYIINSINNVVDI